MKEKFLDQRNISADSQHDTPADMMTSILTHDTVERPTCNIKSNDEMKIPDSGFLPKQTLEMPSLEIESLR